MSSFVNSARVFGVMLAVISMHAMAQGTPPGTAPAVQPPATTSAGVDYRSVGTTVAIAYDSPSRQGRKLFLAPRGMPVEVVSTVNQWIKVRDFAGDSFWLERADITSQRMVIATTTATVRSAPQDSAGAVLQAERGVVLEFVEGPAAPGWVRVRHRDGGSGFVRLSEVWGQ